MKSTLWLAACLCAAGYLGTAVAQDHDHAIGRNMDEIKFTATPGLPDCARNAVLDGDPAKGPSIILGRISAGCTVPWHWHSPNEHLMMVSGRARVDTKQGKPILLEPGGFAKLPGRHLHEFRCLSDCVMYVQADGPFDIHYVDAKGTEIAPEAALKSVRAAAKRR